MFSAMQTIATNASGKSDGLKEKIDNVFGEDTSAECRNAMSLFGLDAAV
jgi:hypothetical protein